MNTFLLCANDKLLRLCFKEQGDNASSAPNRFINEVKTNKYLIKYAEYRRRGSRNISARFLEKIAYTFFLLPSRPSVTQYSVIRFPSPLPASSPQLTAMRAKPWLCIDYVLHVGHRGTNMGQTLLAL